jgi:ATP-binding cassette subfamily B protein
VFENREFPVEFHSQINGFLSEGEIPLAWFAPDLDSRLHYAYGLVVLTNRALISIQPRPQAKHHAFSQSFISKFLKRTKKGDAPDSNRTFKTWPLTSIVSLRVTEHKGIGTLHLLDISHLLTQWKFTTSQKVHAHRLIERFLELKESDKETLSLPETTMGVLRDGEHAVLLLDYAPAAAPPPARSLFRLFKFARPWTGMIILGFLLSVGSIAAGLVPPYITMPLLDKVLIPYQSGKTVDFHRVGWYLFGLAGASLLAWLLGWARTYVLAWVSERVSANLRNITYTHLHRLSLEFFGEKRTGDLISRVSTDSDRICYFLSVHLMEFGSDVLMIIMTAGILLSINPFLAIVTLCPFPLIMWLTHRVRTILRRGFSLGSRAWADMTSVLADTIPGMRVVKAFAQEQREIDRFQECNARVLQANDRINTTWSFFGPMVTLLTDAGLLVVWIFGAWQVFHHHITVGVLTAFLAYIARFYARLEAMIKMVSAVQRTAASAHRVFEILDRVPSVPEVVNPIVPGRFRGEIEFCNVGFHYGSRQVIDNVNLKIRPGEMIGLVGPTGAGKSTLINLVCRFYDVSEGALMVDSTDIRRFSIEGYRHNIGIVLQESFLFYGTIAENIAYGKPNAARSEIIRAARAACAHEFILRLPDGYDTLAGERGQFLSGGERQRIGIARALLIDPAILILDEATSSVDVETEKEIQRALENLVQGRTTIAIAHRLSTLRRADRLVVIERGQIIEVGCHAELLEKQGSYARLHRVNLEMAQSMAT